MKNHKEKIKDSIEKNVNIMNTPFMAILPGQIAFFVVLSIIPLASIIMMILSNLPINIVRISNALYNYIPPVINKLLIQILNEQSVGALDVLFIITAFYLASKATHSIIVASTRIYNGKQTDFIRTRIKAIIILIILVFLALLLVGVLTIGSRLVIYFSGINGSLHPALNTIYSILKWPFVMFMIFFTVKVVYTIAPNVKIPSKSVNRGSLVTTVVWVISTYAFSFYVSKIANYSKFYGNLSNLIILMIWIYWQCYIFVYGMSLNEYALNREN